MKTVELVINGEPVEIWKTVTTEGQIYEVSNKGRVRSHDTVQTRFNGIKVCDFHIKGHILKPFFTGKKTKNSKGYLAVNINRKTVKVHRLVAQAFIPNPNNYPCVNHIDGDTTNNTVENLEWCTNLQNVQHALKTGLRETGEKVNTHKLTQTQVEEIRQKYKKDIKGCGAKVLAKEYGVSDTTIRKIAQGKKWRWD